MPFIVPEEQVRQLRTLSDNDLLARKAEALDAAIHAAFQVLRESYADRTASLARDTDLEIKHFAAKQDSIARTLEGDVVQNPDRILPALATYRKHVHELHRRAEEHVAPLAQALNSESPKGALILQLNVHSDSAADIAAAKALTESLLQLENVRVKSSAAGIAQGR